jgi:hypothetical protein
MVASSSTTIEELLRHSRSDPCVATAFFYFEFEKKHTLPDVIIRSLIEQLTVQSTIIPDVLESLFTKNAGARRSVAQEDQMETLKSIIRSSRTVCLVFDALDECPERSRFLGTIIEIHDWELDTLHLLATSWKERDIEQILSGLVSYEVPMDPSLEDRDIRVHVFITLEEDVKFTMCSAEEKQMVKASLIGGAHGM